MKPLLVLSAMMMLAVSAARAQTPDTIKLTLDEALEVAMSENLTIRIADQEIKKTEYAKKGTYGQLFPQIDLNGSYQRTIEKQTMYMDVAGMEGGMKVGQDNSWMGGVSASMPLISVGLWKSLKISAYDVELAVEKARSSKIEMVDQVKQAYFAVLLANDSKDVFEEAYDNAVSNYNDIKGKYEHGLVAEYDLIRADVNVKNAEPNMYDAANALVLAKWQLKVLLGLDLGVEVECTETLADYEKTLMDSYIAADYSLNGNSTLEQLDIQAKQLKKIKQMQLAQYYPTLNAQFSYDWVSMSNNAMFKNFKWDPYSTVGLSLKIPVFSGGQRLSSVKQAQVNIDQLELQRLDTERNLRLAVKQSSDQMNTCLKQYTAASAGVGQAEKSYLITMKRYETGEGTMLEINDSQLQLTQAQLNLNQSIYNYLIAQSALEKTLGNSIE